MYAATQKPTAIYSAKWAWDKFADYDWVWARDYNLWVAQYDMVPDLDTAIPFSPFTSQNIMGKQYAGTTHIDGVDVDLNDFDGTFFQEDDMGMTPDQEATLNMIARFVTNPATVTQDAATAEIYHRICIGEVDEQTADLYAHFRDIETRLQNLEATGAHDHDG